jgi:dihydroorotate dehydrogenase
VVGSKHYIAELTKATYKFAPDGIMISSAEFGPPPRRVYDYVSALQQQANDAKMVGQIR